MDDEPSGGAVDGLGSAEMVMGVDGSLREDNINGVDFDDDDDDDGAGIVGVVLEICDDAGDGLTVVGLTVVGLAGTLQVLTLGCFNVVS